MADPGDTDGQTDRAGCEQSVVIVRPVRHFGQLFFCAASSPVAFFHFFLFLFLFLFLLLLKILFANIIIIRTLPPFPRLVDVLLLPSSALFSFHLFFPAQVKS
ncbi:MAG: hypothetical protein JOS17DRAFT_754172 [Linnemannia elongata]|nr:MAG: hypothetical protein JOS17DRAFT_754172 [Linnemannia elongata]